MKKEKQEQYLMILGIVIVVIFISYMLYRNSSGDEIISISRGEPPKIILPASENLDDKTKLDTFQVEFDQPVYNLKASDLTINGVPAKNVVGSGAGPYIFYGFSLPDKGDLKIIISSGEIKNEKGVLFDGSSWILRLFKSDEDDDKDGINNAIEVERATNPTKTDTDSDGMSDYYEINNDRCLDPKKDDAQADPDNDGIKNYQEYRSGTSPCI